MTTSAAAALVPHDDRSSTSAMFSVNAPLLITGGHFTQLVHSDSAASDPRKVVRKAFKNHVVHNATHDTIDVTDSPKCHPKTRQAMLTKLSQWASTSMSTSTTTTTTHRPRHLLWLFGPAGAGKSAIARSLAELLSTSNRLGGTFFFLRTADTRDNARLLVSTLAYSLALAVPELVGAMARTVDAFPDVFQQSLETQMERLVVEPVLSLSSGPYRALIVDGLDECGDRDVQCRIIKLFAHASARLNGRLKFLIFSRPEHHIEATFGSQMVSNATLPVDLKDDLHTYDDILIFVQERFQEIKRTHPLKEILAATTWPSEEDVDELIQRSSGNFIYPQTVMKYIEVPYHRPPERLRTILDLSPAQDDSAYAELDCLYHHILSSSRTDRPSLMRILGTMTLFRGDQQNVALACSTCFQERILSLLPGDITLKLLDLRSLISFEAYIPHHPHITFPAFLHTSLFDFLHDPERSREFYVDRKKAKVDVARALLAFLENSVLKLTNRNERTKCDCASQLLCDHKWEIYYNALSWIAGAGSTSWTVELEQVVLAHNLAPVYDLMLSDDTHADIELTSGAHAIPVLYLGVLEFSLHEKPDFLTKHHSNYQQFLTKALTKYHDAHDPLLDALLTLFSTLGTHEFAFVDLDLTRRCIAILFLHHPSCTLPPEERATLLLEVNGARDLRVKFQMVINTLKKRRDTCEDKGALWRALMFTERVVPFQNEYSAARQLTRFLGDEKASGEYYRDLASLQRATVYCLDLVCARYDEMSDNLYQFCQIIRKLLILQLYRDGPTMQDDERSIYLPSHPQRSSSSPILNDLLLKFMSLTASYCTLTPPGGTGGTGSRTNVNVDLIGVEYIDPEEFKIFNDIGQAYLTVSRMSDSGSGSDSDPREVRWDLMAPCLVTFSKTFPHFDHNELVVLPLGRTGSIFSSSSSEVQGRLSPIDSEDRVHMDLPFKRIVGSHPPIFKTMTMKKE